jgi:hypothetical protein
MSGLISIFVLLFSFTRDLDALSVRRTGFDFESYQEAKPEILLLLTGFGSPFGSLHGCKSFNRDFVGIR